MKTHLFNASELATKIAHPGPVQHLLGSPKTDAYGQALGGAVQVQVKPRPLKKTIDHDEVDVEPGGNPGEIRGKTRKNPGKPRKTMGIGGKTHGKPMENPWKKRGKNVGKQWILGETHGKTIWEIR